MRGLLALLVAGASLGLLVASACGSAELTVYSGRNEQLVGPLLERFKEQSGIDLEVRYGGSAELAATLAEEGENSPADVFLSQEVGALGSVEERLAALPSGALRAVPERFRDPRGRWVGVSGRARVLAYSTERLREGALPASVLELTRPEWRGRVGFAPSNASFQAFVSAMRLELGDERTRAWLEAMRANAPKLYENNIQTVEAIARGEADVGLVNHYYLYELRAERPDLPVANHFLAPGDPGALVNAAGVGVLRTSDRAEDAQRFVRFLLSAEAQGYFARETAEYPLAAGVRPREELPPLADVAGPDVELGALGEQLRSTLEMLDRAGFTA